MTPAERMQLLLEGEYELDVPLSKSHERIAKVLQQRLEEAVFMDARELAEAVGTTPSTIVRFAQRLGFSGYPELRMWLADLLLHKASPVARAESVIRTYAGSDLFLAEFCANEARTLSALPDTIAPEQLRAAVEILKDASRIFLFAEGPAACIVHLLAFRLGRLRHTVIPITETGKAFFEKAALVERGDAVLAFGLGRPAEELRAILVQSRRVDARSILVTDNTIAELNRWASVVLTIPLRAFDVFRAMVIPVAVAESLALALMLDDPGRTKESLAALERFRREHGYPRIPRVP
ncbi:MAG: MurR/RpiR family transcriptional regulator [Clostridia bacterium]|nr:hypothetical protein [Bacillota bacterium]MBO2521193.1 hypothetical protein [Bacillota bacterium]